MNIRQFPFAASVVALFGLFNVLLSSCGGTPAAPNPFTGIYKGSIVYAIGNTNIPLTFERAEVDSSGNFVCNATYQGFSGMNPITVPGKVGGSLGADGSAALTLNLNTKMTGKLSLKGNKLTGAVAEDGTNNTVTVRLLFDLSRQ